MFTYNKAIISSTEIENSLRTAGLEKGDICMLHSKLTDIGVPDRSLLRSKQLLPSLISCFENVLGREGTLVIPSFSYSFCKGEIFDQQNTPTTVGVLNEYFRKQEGTIRSSHPIFSVCARGPAAKDIVRVDDDSFGSNSCFGNITRLNGKILTFGTDLRHATYFHYPEQIFGVPYRFIKEFPGTRIIDGKPESATATFNVRRLNYEIIADTSDSSIVCRHLRKTEMLGEAQIGGAPIRCGRAQDFFEQANFLLKDNIFSLLKNPIPELVSH